jgi:regulator of protease activity HflC (stomatin/prohibitin superfamily)
MFLTDVAGIHYATNIALRICRRTMNCGKKDKEYCKMKIGNIAALGLLALLAGCGQVDSGHTGLKLWWGRIVSEPLGPGLWFYNPVGGSLVVYDCREQRVDLTMNAYTKDVQSAEFQIVVTFSLNKNQVIELHNEVGSQYVDKILTPAVIGRTKDVVGQWEADRLINGREQATKEIFNQVCAVLKNTPIRVSSVVLARIDYSDVFEKAIEDKQVAMQNAIRAKNKTQEIEELARQKVIAAEAEAKSMKIRGDALKENPGLVQLEAIGKWDGKAPQTLVVGEEAKPLLSVGK